MELNKFIDHTLLRPDATAKDISKLCEEANQYNFASVCVAPCWSELAHSILLPKTKLCIVQDFPHGNGNHQKEIITDVDEIDFVVNIGYIKSGKWHDVEENVYEARRSCQYITWDEENRGIKEIIIKYIVEVGYLTDEELFKIADLLIKHKIDFIKTCTGYGPRNVTLEDIVKIKKHVGDRIKIKASGGIKTAEFAKQLIEAGADRLGTSSGVSIMNEISKQGENIHATSESSVAGY